MYPIFVWEFKNLNSIDLNNVVINKNMDLSHVKFWSGETLDSNSSIPVTIKRGFSFQGGLSINLDSYSKITGTFKGRNYKGFYGIINEMAFSNKKGEPQIVFDYTDGSFSPSLFLLYKAHHSFYVIIINSKQPFKNADMINILNLKR